MQNLQRELSIYKGIEKSSHVDLDDVLNKVTQEVGELLEALENGNQDEIYKEAGDVISNILSVCFEMGILEGEDYSKEDLNQENLMILLGKWNSKIQALRKRFSKEDVGVEEAKSITKKLVGVVLNFTDSSQNLGEIIKTNALKFEKRQELYKLKIDLRDYIGDYPDFPKTGIIFKDISPLLKSPEALRYAVMEMSEKCWDSEIIVGLDARGFIFGSLVAQELNKPFVMLRKKGKLPGKTKEVSYGLEYGKDVLEIQEGVMKKGQKVSIIDDLLATGGTIKAAIDLVEASGGVVNNLSFVVSLDDDFLSNLDSRKILSPYKIDSLISYN